MPERVDLMADRPFVAQPSITKQTRWPCGLYRFGKLEGPGVSYFNPSLVQRHDGLWLITRRSRNAASMRFGINDLVAFRLDNNVPAIGKAIQLEKRWPDEQFEDPRAMMHNGRTFIGCCDFVWTDKGWTGAHQIICEVSDQWVQLHRFDPVFGKNGDNLGRNSGHEKNWIWFFYEDRPHLVYSADPHIVIRFNNDFTVANQYMCPNSDLSWDHGEIRGGTPPVLVNGEYWSFFHGATWWRHPKENRRPKRQYHMGAYAFEAKPPFRVTKMTSAPILSGSQEDPWAEDKPLVVFPCGAVLRGDKWLVSLGVNDLVSGWIEIPHADLEGIAPPVNVKRRSIMSVGRELVRSLVCPRLNLKDVTLVCVDDRRPDLAQKAIEECQRHCNFGAVKFLTSRNSNPPVVPIAPVRSLEDYSRFMIKELLNHVATSHVLVVQWDGYVINPSAWEPDWLQYDYIGSPWPNGGLVGNGGFSLRSVKLLKTLQQERFKGPYMPEDSYICKRFKPLLENFYKLRFAPLEVAGRFSVENGTFEKQFGFHSFLTKFDRRINRPGIFHHSGDLGDIIYGLATMKELGGGVLFLSPQGPDRLPNFPPRQEMTEAWAQNIVPLLNAQPYVWKAQWTGEYPPSTDYNLNEFRFLYGLGLSRGKTLVQLHAEWFKAKVDDSQPWLTVDYPVSIRPIVINRSSRYHGRSDWKSLVANYNKDMVFIGSPKEHEDFVKEFGEVDYFETPTLLEAARIIAGAKVFIGNQSCPMAIALGLGKNTMQELWDEDPNCRLKRNNLITLMHGPVIPQGWL